MPHELTTKDVEWAMSEVVYIPHTLASATARDGGRKKLTYNPHTRIFTIETDKTERTCGAEDMAAQLYSDL